MNTEIQKLRAVLQVAERLESTGSLSQEDVDIFRANATQGMIDAIEQGLADAGLPPIPAILNPGQPEFLAAMARLKALQATGDDDSPEYQRTFLTMTRTAPAWWKLEMERVAECFGLPQPGAYDDAGNPLYDLAEVAERLGVCPEEAAEQLMELQAVMPGEKLLHHGPVHRIQ